MAVSADGRTVLSAGRDRTVCLWEVSSGQRVAVLEVRVQGLSRFCLGPAWDLPGICIGHAHYISSWGIPCPRDLYLGPSLLPTPASGTHGHHLQHGPGRGLRHHGGWWQRPDG